MAWDLIAGLVAEQAVRELVPALAGAVVSVGAWWFRGRKWVSIALLAGAVGLAGVWLWNYRFNVGHEAGRAELQAEINQATQELNEAWARAEEASQALAFWRDRWRQDTDELQKELELERISSDDDSAWSAERVHRFNRAIGRSE